jgi:hypothetical protein
MMVTAEVVVPAAISGKAANVPSVENRVVVVDLLAAAEADGVVRAMAFLEVLLVTSRARSFALIT